MKKRSLLIALAVVIILSSLVGCTPAKAITTGSFSGATYSNDFFNMTFTVPDSWAIATKDEMAKLFNASADLIGSDNKDAEKAMKLAQQKTLYLAYASAHPLDYAEGFNSNINVICTNLGLAGFAVKNSKDYAEAALKQMKDSFANMKDYTFSFSDITSKTINGVEYAVIDDTLTTQGVDIRQQMYCTLKKNYAIMVTMSWLDDADAEALQTIADSMSFK